MANYEATRYNFDGANLSGVEGINTGVIVPWSASSVPSGFLECNGSNVSRSTYSALFAVIGTTYGSNVAGSTANATLSTAQLASHSHPMFGQPADEVSGGVSPMLTAGMTTGNAGSGGGHQHNMSANFVGDATSVLQPYITVIYIIKT